MVQHATTTDRLTSGAALALATDSWRRHAGRKARADTNYGNIEKYYAGLIAYLATWSWTARLFCKRENSVRAVA